MDRVIYTIVKLEWPYSLVMEILGNGYFKFKMANIMLDARTLIILYCFNIQTGFYLWPFLFLNHYHPIVYYQFFLLNLFLVHLL